MTWSHVFIAIAMQGLVRAFNGDWWAGAAIASAFYVGRELTQAEYRWIEMFGQGRRTNMPWWGQFDPRVWRKADAWVDWIAPVLAVLLIALFASSGVVPGA